MEPEEPLMQGILLLPPQGMLGQLKKTWHKRFCQLFRTSNYGIKRVEIYDNQEDAILQSHSPRIITLDACIKIAPSNQSHIFTVVTKSGIHYFGCYSEMEMTHWITAFQLVAFKFDSILNQTLEENNDLYCTSGEGVFSVKVVETDASKRCGLEARNYTLVVAAADMKLMDGNIVLFTWPYRYIRRYGYRDGKFMFEAGRKCESGEGSFRLEHASQQEIFRCVYAKLRSMKKLLNEENNPNIECDAQYQAALSMEPGSRAALPPSLNNSSTLIDIDFSTSQNSQKPLTSSSSSSIDSISSSRLTNKSKPAKPPRKYVFPNLLEKKNSDSDFLDLPTCGEYRALSQANSPELSHKTVESVSREEEGKNPYDLVEVRNDAWKTHGIDNVHHTERINSILPEERDKEDDDDDMQYEIMMPLRNHDGPFQNSAANKSDPAVTTSSMVKNVTKTDESDYDKLEHYGSTAKVGYKYTNSSQSIHSNTSHGQGSNLINSAWSNYDIVEDMSAVRLADDSHLGYGIIRKKMDLPETVSADNTVSSPQHKVFNNSEYAIVSKPKRV